MTSLDQKELGLYATEFNNMDFVAQARAIAREYSLKYGSVTMDNVRSDPRMDHLTPSSPNAWGSIFHEDGWRLLDYVPSQIKSNHHRVIGRWRWEK